MKKLRLIARLDIKNNYVIKGIHLEGLRKVGNPVELATKYYNEGIDEIVFMDSVASLYGRNNLFHIIKEACKEVFIPITIGGGLRSIDDIKKALDSGADKITLNTQAVKTPEIIAEASKIYGSQCIIGSIEAKQNSNGWEVYVDNGREVTGIDVLDWVRKIEDLGVGEILLTSIDKEGTKKGFDLKLIEEVNNIVSVPLIVSGGAGNSDHIEHVIKELNVHSIAVASLIHYNIETIGEIKKKLQRNKIAVRHDY
jgi:cyclase